MSVLGFGLLGLAAGGAQVWGLGRAARAPGAAHGLGLALRLAGVGLALGWAARSGALLPGFAGWALALGAGLWQIGWRRR